MRNSVRGLFALVIPVAVLAAGCSGQPNPVQPTAGTTVGSDVGVAPQGEASSILADVRRATADFHDIDKAFAAGYVIPEGSRCEQSAAGIMGVHAINPGLIAEPGVFPLKPEVLLYLPKPGGGYRLIGVEYFQPVLLKDTATGAVAPWFSHDPWPATYVVVNTAPSLFGQTFQGPMAGHAPGMPWHYDLHVWAWAPNPSGAFAQWNPSLSCGA